METDLHYLGEVIACASPRSRIWGWQLCDGSLLSINEYEALYSLMGTTYGGDGVTTFAVPDLRGRIVVSAGKMPEGDQYSLGMSGGKSSVALTLAELPGHTHQVQASTAIADAVSPVGAIFATPGELAGSARAYLSKQYGSVTTVTISPQVVAAAGSGGPHLNIMPTLGLHYMICTMGLYPA